MTPKVKETKALGRPSKYKPEYCAMLIEHMAKGFSYETFGAIIDVVKTTIYTWEQEYPDFLDAKKKAFAKCQIFWEQQGQLGLWSDKEKQLNSAVWIFNMKNRFNWTDKREVTGATDVTLHKSKEQKQFIEEFKRSIQANDDERKGKQS